MPPAPSTGAGSPTCSSAARCCTTAGTSTPGTGPSRTATRSTCCPPSPGGECRSAPDGAHRARWLQEAGLVDPVARLLARQAGVDEVDDLVRVVVVAQRAPQIGLAPCEEARAQLTVRRQPQPAPRPPEGHRPGRHDAGLRGPACHREEP